MPANPERRRQLAKLYKMRRYERLKKDPTLAPHGENSTYNNWGCRCDDCTAAHNRESNLYYKLARLRRAQ